MAKTALFGIPKAFGIGFGAGLRGFTPNAQLQKLHKSG